MRLGSNSASQICFDRRGLAGVARVEGGAQDRELLIAQFHQAGQATEKKKIPGHHHTANFASYLLYLLPRSVPETELHMFLLFIGSGALALARGTCCQRRRISGFEGGLERI